MRQIRIRPFPSLLILILSLSAGGARPATPLTTTVVASGLSQPLFVTAAPADTSRIFILERTGKIKIVKNGTLLTRPFLDVGGLITASYVEDGLLGMAFHPQYATNGYFYLDFTGHDTSTFICRFKVSADPDSADIATQMVLLNIKQPYANHKGGMMAFGPIDHYLYIGMGDGGLAGDPGNRAQSDTTLLGKMLRINVDGPSMIPPNNPFVDSVGALKEIWAKGVRNPWRWSFDRRTANMFIGDVGQDTWEEIDFQPSTSHGGENYGWRLMEGPACYNPPSGCQTGVNLVLPVYFYNHSVGRCGVIGGYVYRGCAIPDLNGAYFLGDLCTGEIWSFHYDTNTVSNIVDHTTELGSSGISLSSFGEDAKGELYICNLNGTVLKIVPRGIPSQCSAVSPCCNGVTGNVDGDPADVVDISDLSAMVDYLFFSGTISGCFQEDDVDRSGNVDISDLQQLIDYLFFSASLPSCP